MKLGRKTIRRISLSALLPALALLVTAGWTQGQVVTESGALPAGLTFTAGTDGTATISGAPGAGTAGSYPVTISATNASGGTATLALTITVPILGAVLSHLVPV